MKRKSNRQPTREELRAYAKAAGVEEEKRELREREKRKLGKQPRSNERTYEISWYAPAVGRRVTYNRPVVAANKEGAIREVRAWLRTMSFREHKGVTNFIAKEMARKTNSKKARSSRQSAVGRKTNRTVRKKNLFGLGKKAKRKRSAKLRKKADVLEAKAQLLRARSRNKAKAKAAGRRTNKPITMTYEQARSVAVVAATRQMKKAGRRQWNRADVQKAVSTFSDLYGGTTTARQPNPPIWADIIGGLAGGAGYATAAAWVGEKMKKKRKTNTSAKPKAKRAANTTSTTRLYKEFQGRNPKGEVVKLYTPPGTPPDVSMMGPLIEIRLANGETIKFSNTDRGALKNPKAYLGQAQRGPSRRVYVGLVEPYGRFRNGEPINRSVSLGEGKFVAYWAAKPHLTGHNRMVPWQHPWGDRGGRRPNVVITKEGCIALRGGDYSVESGGIDN